MPTNKELAIKYSTSEVTVRKSLASLAAKGYLKSIERIGTFVRDKEKSDDNYSIFISPHININEEITNESIESIYMSLVKVNEIYVQAIETRKILYSGPIPICYMIDSLFISNKINPGFITKVTESKSDMISKLINSFENKKTLEITMNDPDLYIKNKLLLNEDDPILCFTIYYYTKSDSPVAKSVYYVSGENIELKGKSVSI